ncbi:hypothetical protein DEO72_LG4g676 [Vigna unguiculata]|uniref:Uncharacterized protein n=1 Tax=Vigna unguiculata TaxID=3917 RepID=A0A4D6LMG6_VIGUN|nr:hypothetical protein DEO72_LG4g676 [Vigna unguiculata]
MVAVAAATGSSSDHREPEMAAALSILLADSHGTSTRSATSDHHFTLPENAYLLSSRTRNHGHLCNGSTQMQQQQPTNQNNANSTNVNQQHSCISHNNGNATKSNPLQQRPPAANLAPLTQA